MRTLALALAASTLSLAGCGKKQDAANTAAASDDISARDFATNDVTAIDAATGADANMAADVELNFVSTAGDDPAGTRARPRKDDKAESPRPGSNNSSEPAEPAESEPTPPATESNSG